MGVDSAARGFLSKDRGIILAADVDSLEDLGQLVRLCAAVPEVVAIKIGFSLALRVGLQQTVASVRKFSQVPVIYDHQKAGTDIPEMGRPFANVCAEAGVQAVIVFPLAGPRTLEEFVTAAFTANLTPVVGLVMSHAAYLQSEGGFIVDDAPDSMCRIALDLGVRSFVLPGTKPETVIRFAHGPLMSAVPTTIMMPGIGAQGGSVATAFQAARPHRRFAIVGSAIYRAVDPSAALSTFAAQVRE